MIIGIGYSKHTFLRNTAKFKLRILWWYARKSEIKISKLRRNWDENSWYKGLLQWQAVSKYQPRLRNCTLISVFLPVLESLYSNLSFDPFERKQISEKYFFLFSEKRFFCQIFFSFSWKMILLPISRVRGTTFLEVCTTGFEIRLSTRYSYVERYDFDL